MSKSYKFKIVLLGEGRVGKTSLLLRYIENRFSERQQSTIQASYLEKRLNIGSNSITLAIWDTAGQERFHALAPIYYRDAQGAILVYDITDKTSFRKVEHWVEELRKIVGEDIILMLSANKIDMKNKQQVSDEEAQRFTNAVGGHLIKTSAKSGVGVEDLFLETTKKLLKQQLAKERSAPTGNNGRRQKSKINIDDDDDKPEGGGCC